jgi:O-6-methylguanine DNA methyltransferase
MRISDASALELLLRGAAPRLVAAGAEELLQRDASIVEWIRGRAEEEKSGKSWFLTVESAQDGTFAGLAGLQRIDPFRSSAEFLLLVSLDESRLLEVIDRILKTAFYHFGLHRVEMRLPIEKGQPTDLFGWTREGVLRGASPREDGYRDVALLSMLREEFDGYGIAFVPFARGYVHVRGDRDAVEEIGFLKADQPVEAGPLRSAAFLQGLCDREGVLVSQGTSTPGTAKPTKLPAEVQRAAHQIEEYVTGGRTSFEIRTNASGSLFQHNVWNTLLEIPYGTTLTYEQVALRLSKQEPEAARRLTRAIGSACSANPIAIVVPCHRVIGKDNKLVGFSGGLDVKEWLLEHEMFGVH